MLMFRFKFGKLFFGLAFFLCIYAILYSLSPNKATKAYNDVTNDVTKINTRAQCTGLLKCLTNGTWTVQRGLNAEDISKRREKDAYMLEYQGWPRKLFRSDLKCGENYPPVGKSVGKSICDGQSDKPCCNEKTQTCGNTQDDCTCESCTNFTKYLPAEISEWNVWNKECRIDNLDHTEACEFFNKHISEMVFVGDSLTRHFYVALVLLLTDNYATGAIRPEINQEQKEKCQGELQFVDSGKYGCHRFTAKKWEQLHNVCNGEVNFKVYLEEAYNYNLFPNAVKAIESLLNKTGSVVVMNVGIHMSLNSEEVIKKYVGPIVDMIASRGNGWPKLIWHDLHSVDNFLRSEIQPLFTSWKKFNHEMKEYFRKVQVDVLQTTLLTNSLLSYDFRHFGLGGNMAKLQVLLKYLRNWFQNCPR